MTQDESRLNEAEEYFKSGDYIDSDIEWLISELRAAWKRENVMREALEYFNEEHGHKNCDDSCPDKYGVAQIALERVKGMRE